MNSGISLILEGLQDGKKKTSESTDVSGVSTPTGGFKKSKDSVACPECGSKDIETLDEGYKCNECGKTWTAVKESAVVDEGKNVAVVEKREHRYVVSLTGSNVYSFSDYDVYLKYQQVKNGKPQAKFPIVLDVHGNNTYERADCDIVATITTLKDGSFSVSAGDNPEVLSDELTTFEDALQVAADYLNNKSHTKNLYAVLDYDYNFEKEIPANKFKKV